MPRPSRFSSLRPERMTRIALRIRNRMNKLGLNESELAHRCNQLAGVLQEGERPRLSRERIAKILMNCKAKPEKSAARVISPQEIILISHALKVAPEWMIGQEDKRDPVFWNPLAEPQRADHILHLLEEYKEKAGEVTVWAEFLLAPLVTPEFMHEYHEVRFAELDMPGSHQVKDEVVRVFDHIGNVRRKWLLAPRSYLFTQIIFLSELERLFKGTEEYGRMSKNLLKPCVENLRRLIADPSLHITLAIVPDKGAEISRRVLRDYDSLSVFGRKFTLWSYHSGNVAWSEHKSYVDPHYRLLQELQERALYRTRDDVLIFLDKCLAVM
jgi:hypothetical protein